MRKMLNIAWKDVLQAFRDPAALILMLATPFALSLVIGFAFGGFGGGDEDILADIPVAIVNHDEGELGAALADAFTSEDLADLVDARRLDDEALARRMVDDDELAAAVIVPSGFSARVIPSVLNVEQAQDYVRPETGVVHIYANPARTVSASVVQAIVDSFLARVNAGAAAGQVIVGGLVESGRISPEQALESGEEIGRSAATGQAAGSLIALVDEGGAPESGSQDFDWVAYITPSMAVFFLMFTVTAGARSLLAEREEGTLSRLLVTPSSAAQVLGGKVGGIYLTGLAQMLVLILASRILLGISWGSPLPTAVLVLALVAAATGWGVLLAAYARTPGQVGATGNALALIFGATAGNFVPRPMMPAWLRTASLISPNAWGLDAFLELGRGAGLARLATPILALSAMASVLFFISLLAFRRQYK